MSDPCPSEAELMRLLEGGLTAQQQAALLAHLDGCHVCQNRLETLGGGGLIVPDFPPSKKSPESTALAQVMGNLAAAGAAGSAAQTADPLLSAGAAPKRFGNYEIASELGRGGMGVVYRAKQLALNRTVALKLVLAGQLASPREVRRFRTEAEAAGRLEHPNIVPIYEVGEYDGQHFLSMRLVEGTSLAESISGSSRREEAQTSKAESRKSKAEIQSEPPHVGCYTGKEAAGLLATLAHAVYYAHQRGVLHRDLKPSNILLDAEGQPHLTDFGLAKLLESDSNLTDLASIMGSPNYMAPEIAEGRAREATTAVDVYSLGAILFEVLTGRPPFQEETVAATLREVTTVEAPPPSRFNPAVTRDLDTITLTCLQKEPARRYRTALEFAEDLEHFIRGEPIAARPVTSIERAWRWCQRKPALAGSLVALAGVFVVGFCGVVWKWNGEIRQRKLAQQESQRAQKAVTRLETERAESLLQAGDSTKGLAYLARLLRQQPTNHVVAERLMSALTYRSFCLPVAPLRHGHALNSVAGERKERSDKLEVFAFFHPGSLVTANFSPDGWRVVTASEDGTARLWNALTGEPVGEPLRHEAEVLWAQFSGDGQRIVTASVDGSARIWRADTSQLAAPPLRHHDIVHFAAFSPDGQKVVTASRDNTVRIWNAQTGQPIGVSLIHPKPAYFACFSPDGRRILTADESEHARLWDERTGSAIAAADHFHFWSCPEPFPQFSPSLGQVVTLRRYNAFVRNPQSNLVEVARLQHDNFVTGISFSPDGRRSATVSSDGTARIWDTGTGEVCISPLRHDGKAIMAHFSSDGQRIVTGSGDKSARLWEVRTGQVLTEPMRHEHAVLSAKIGAGGQRVATVSKTDTAWLWDVRLLQPLTVLRWLPFGARSDRFSPDGRQVMVLDEANAVRVWNAQSGLPQTKAMGHAHPERRIIKDAQFSPDGRRLVTAAETVAETPSGYGGETQIWDASTGEPIGRPLAGLFIPHYARFSPDGTKLVTSSGDGTVRMWDVESGEQQLELQHFGQVEFRRGAVEFRRVVIEFSPDGKLIVTASSDATVQIWDAATGRPLGKPLKHAAEVFWLAFDRAGQRLATASKDKTARIWSVRTGQMLTPPLIHADVLHAEHSLTFSPDGSRLATAAGSSAQVWDAASGRAVTTPLRHGGLVQTVQFSPDGRKLLSASEDGTARLWDPETGHPVSEPMRHGAQVTSAEFSPDGSRLVTFSSDKGVRIWEVTQAPLPVPDWLPALAEAVAGQHIDEKEVGEVLSVEVLYRLRQTLSANTASDYYGRWARWFFADSTTRAISPSSDVTVPEYVKRRIEENTRESLQEATVLSSTNALAFARLAQNLIATNQTVRAEALVDAEWFSRYATNLAPHDLETGQIRKAVLESLRNSPTALKP